MATTSQQQQPLSMKHSTTASSSAYSLPRTSSSSGVGTTHNAGASTSSAHLGSGFFLSFQECQVLRKFALSFVTAVTDTESCLRSAAAATKRSEDSSSISTGGGAHLSLDIQNLITAIKADVPFGRVFDILKLDFPVESLLNSSGISPTTSTKATPIKTRGGGGDGDDETATIHPEPAADATNKRVSIVEMLQDDMTPPRSGAKGNHETRSGEGGTNSRGPAPLATLPFPTRKSSTATAGNSIISHNGASNSSRNNIAFAQQQHQKNMPLIASFGDGDDTLEEEEEPPGLNNAKLESHASMPHFLAHSQCDAALLAGRNANVQQEQQKRSDQETETMRGLLKLDLPPCTAGDEDIDEDKLNPAGFSTTSLHQNNYDNPQLSSRSQAKDVEYTDVVKKDRGDDGLKTINNYVILDELGRGQYGKVKLAAIGDSNRMRAIKIIPRSRLKQKFIGSQHHLMASSSETTGAQQHPSHHQNSRLHREVEIMKKLKHPNIIRLCEVIDDPNSNKLYLVMQYVERGPILSLDKKGQCVPLDIHVAKSYMKQLIEALMYLHHRGICHRDIKPDNILLGANGRVYIGDFGVSGMFAGEEADGTEELRDTKGTPLFLAPEEFVDDEDEQSSNPLSDADHSTALDIWALGLTFYVMLSGQLPFDPCGSFQQIGERIKNVNIDFNVETYGLSEQDPLSPRGGASSSSVTFASIAAASSAAAGTSASSPKMLLRQRNEHNPFNVGDDDDDEMAFSMIGDEDLYHTTMPTDEELAMDLISQMLHKNPLERMTIREARAHPFISDTAYRKLEKEHRRNSGTQSSHSPVAPHLHGGPLPHQPSSGALVGPKITPRRVQAAASSSASSYPDVAPPDGGSSSPLVYVPPVGVVGTTTNVVEASEFDIVI